jgi:glutamate-1-semialdehyde 2,1-aminomutase
VNFEKSNLLRQRCHSLIPGGAHTYSKGDDQYPVEAPGFIVKGEGCHVWDLDGNEFIEYGMGLRSVTLGHGYRLVVEAAHRQMQMGSNFTRPAAIELECAEELLGIINGADMVKFAKNGSDVTTAAVKLARAYTGRDLIAICAEHPFFSTDDWFIGSTSMASGIPRSIQDLSVKFHYNDLKSVESLFNEYSERIACLLLEPATSVEPQASFLQDLRRICSHHGTVLIFDEMITGFRWDLGGAQKCYSVVPDLSTFGKAIANGFSVSALVGRRELMELGGLCHSKERVFLLSTTHGAETHALAAAIASMRVYKECQVVEFLYSQGEKLQTAINGLIRELKLEGYFQVVGRPCNLVYVTRDAEKMPSQAFRALFLQETIKHGLLTPSLVISFSHKDCEIERTIEAIGESLVIYRKALEDGIGNYLVGPPVKPVFRKYN